MGKVELLIMGGGESGAVGAVFESTDGYFILLISKLIYSKKITDLNKVFYNHIFDLQFSYF